MEAYHAVPRLLPLTRCGKKYAGPTFQICPKEHVPLKMKAVPQIGDRVLMPFSEDWQEAQNNGQTERVAIRLYRLFRDSKTHGSIGQRYLKGSFFSSEFNFESKGCLLSLSNASIFGNLGDFSEMIHFSHCSSRWSWLGLSTLAGPCWKDRLPSCDCLWGGWLCLGHTTLGTDPW